MLCCVAVLQMMRIKKKKKRLKYHHVQIPLSVNDFIIFLISDFLRKKYDICQKKIVAKGNTKLMAPKQIVI